MHILCMRLQLIDNHLQPSSGLKATNCSLQEHYSNTKVITGFFIACSRAPSLGFSNNSSHLLLSTRRKRMALPPLLQICFFTHTNIARISLGLIENQNMSMESINVDGKN
ncbi:hypothetical protein P8452_61891 [Trifolium repens]|nr:hypothetical protein P8452_61891 [Trifolium repens]